MSIAMTIKSQIGPGSLMRVGAHTFMADGNSLIIHTGRGHKNKIIITLDASDTYTIETVKITRSLDIVRKTIASDIYADQLSQIIADMG